jgi:hypothetical protein
MIITRYGTLSVISTSSINPVVLKSRGVILLCAGGCIGGGRQERPVRSDARGARYNVAGPLSVGNDIYVGGSCRRPCAILGYCSLDRERRARGTRCFFGEPIRLVYQAQKIRVPCPIIHCSDGTKID